MNQTAETKKDISYYYWPVGIITFFLVIAGFNTFLAVTAFSGRPAATESDPYEASLKYNQKFEALQTAKSLELTEDFTITRSGENLIIEYPLPKSLSPQSIQSAKLKLIKPDEIERNSEVSLQLNPQEKALEGIATKAKQGLWMLELWLNTGDEPALIESKIYVQ